MIKVKRKDYPENAFSRKMVKGETVEVKASVVKEVEGSLVLYKRKVSLKLAEVARFDPHEWESWTR